MTAITFYAALKFWLPTVTAFTLVYKGYKATGKGLTAWADRLLNNHLGHIQIATEDTALSMKTLAETSVRLLEEIRNDGRAAAVAVAQVQIDLKETHSKGDDRFRTIATDLAILKDRL